MKNIFKKLSLLLILATVAVACDQTEDVNYTPKVYDKVPGDLTVTFTNAMDNSFDVNFASSKDGIVYYKIQPTGGDVPTGADLVNGQVKYSLTPGATETTTYNNAVYGGYEFEVYSVMASPDGYLSDVLRSTVTTPDTSDPMFLPKKSSPKFDKDAVAPALQYEEGVSPFTTVTFAFDEPVFYQGGDITFSGFNSGRAITVNGAEVTGSGTTTITISDHGTFAEDDFIIVTWAADTFKDKVGKSVAELNGFNHYFNTRLFTLAEKAFLMQGTWEYSTAWWGALQGFYNANASLFLPESGQFELKLDPSDPEGLTLLGVNVFSPLNQLGDLNDPNNGFLKEPDNLKIKLGEDGELEVIDPLQLSGVPAQGSTFPFAWGHFSFFGAQYPGFYDFNKGEIQQWNSLIVEDSGAKIDDVDYNYVRVGSYSKSSAKVFAELEARNKKRKAAITNGATQQYSEIKIGSLK